MLLKKRLLKTFLIILLLSTNFICYAQEKYNVYFYGVIIPPSQENQKNITLDLFSAQIRAFPEINFFDRRNEGFDKKYDSLSDKEANTLDEKTIFKLIPSSTDSIEGNKSILLVAKIDKNDDDKWSYGFYTKNLYNGKINSIEKTSDSYYKILTESRTHINSLLSSATNQKAVSAEETQVQKSQTASEPISMDGISGTWAGEEGITKVIIMRSGRGFVIFNNGASMNISISVDTVGSDKVLNIVQASPFNASYYPDIPRQQILNFASTAKPIKWTFNVSENSTLSGKKETLTIDNEGSVAETKLSVKWNKIN